MLYSEILYYTVFSTLLIVKSIWINIWIRENISYLRIFMKIGKSEKRLVSKIEGAQFYLSRDPLSRTRHTQNEHRSFQVSASFFPERNFYSLGAIRPVWTSIPKEMIFPER